MKDILMFWGNDSDRCRAVKICQQAAIMLWPTFVVSLATDYSLLAGNVI